jgi:quercetin dioxygenase-like cupin family protein
MTGDPASGDPGATAGAAVIVADPAGLALGESSLEIYSAAIGVRLLYQDPASGAEHYLIRYPPGMTALRHQHSAAHTIVVLEGQLVANGHALGPGGYCHFPARTAMHHAPAAGAGCLFVTIFDGPFDVHPLGA